MNQLSFALVVEDKLDCHLPIFDLRKAIGLDIPSMLDDVKRHIFVPVVETSFREVADVHYAHALDQIFELVIYEQRRLEDFLLVKCPIFRMRCLTRTVVPVYGQVSVASPVARITAVSQILSIGEKGQH